VRRSPGFWQTLANWDDQGYHEIVFSINGQSFNNISQYDNLSLSRLEMMIAAVMAIREREAAAMRKTQRG
jgi:hypothetical protein